MKPCTDYCYWFLLLSLQLATDIPLSKTVFKAWKEKLKLFRAKTGIYRCSCALRAHRSFPMTLTHLFPAFLTSLKWPKIIRPSLLCSSCCVENRMGMNWGIQPSRKHTSSCRIAVKHFLHPQLQGLQMKSQWKENSICVYLFNMFTYVRCSEGFLQSLKPASQN